MRSRAIALGLVILGLIAVPWAQAQQAGSQASSDYRDSKALPQGLQGARIQALIDAINSGNPDHIRTFLEKECTGKFRMAFPLEEHVGGFLRFLGETGGVDFYSIRSYTPERTETVVIVKDRDLDSYWGLNLRFGESPAFLLDGLGFNAARPPLDLNEPPLTEKKAVAEIDALVNRLAATGKLSGTVLVARGADILLTNAAGEASKAYHVANNIDTKFNLGSMNKMFTATAAAMLVEQGKLSFDDPIGKYIDETWLPKDVTSKIRVRHLLTHTSGLGSYFNETYVRSSRELFRKLDDYKPLIKVDRPAFTPGQKYQYSNTGMFLMGVIIEKVTGEDYFSHISRAVYEPAGMTNTDCYEMDRPVENLAIGYSPDPKSPYKWQNNLYKHVIKGGPAGGGFSTVKDLHRFALALLSGKLVSKSVLDTMWADYIGAGYGYGFGIRQGGIDKVVGHSGGFAGINSELNIHVRTGYIVAVMSNVDNGASPLTTRINLILGRIKP